MTDTLDPGLLSLLEAALADDSSTFRRIAAVPIKRAYGSPLSAGAPFLSMGERHLLRHHREEVAHLLYEGCLLTLQGPVERSRTILHGKPVDGHSWRRRIHRALDSGSPHWPDEREALRAPVRDGFGSREARIALHLAPSDDLRYALAGLNRIEGALEDSRQMAREIIGNSSSPGHRASAWTVMGTCQHLSGLHGDALDSYRNAFRTDYRATPALPNCFTQALFLGDLKEAAQAAALLNETEDSLAPIRERYGAVLDHDPLVRSHRVPQDMRDSISRKPLGPTARRVLDAFS